jgi:hypothetical protein
VRRHERRAEDVAATVEVDAGEALGLAVEDGAVDVVEADRERDDGVAVPRRR